ncbi:hypothetical protein REPUB_Repub09cG0176800 [Reevesia pubescens]
MGWLTKILKGSSNKGRYRDRYGDDRTWDEPRRSVEGSDGFDKDEIDRAIAVSLSEVDQKGKKVIEDESELEEESDEDEPDAKGHLDDEDDKSTEAHVEEEEDKYAKAHVEEEDDQYTKVQWEEDEEHAKVQLEEDEQLAKAIQESLKVESPPRYDHGGLFSPYPFFFSSSYRVCAGCNAEIGHGRYLSCMGAVWHPECFRCQACNQPINDYEFSVSGNRPFHKSCYKQQHHPKCDVCKKFIPTNPAGLIEYRAHPYWMQKYCPSHERDGTPRCCSCERMEPTDAKYLSLDDGRKLCLECLDSAIMDTHECQPLYVEIQEFYEGLNMKLEQQVPLLLVERQALNEAMEGEKNGHHHLPETRGLCLSEEQTVTTVLRRPRIGAGYRFIDMITEPYRLIRRCEVTAILILYGLPRLLTGSILAHEMMHAWLRLKGYPNLSPEVEEGICQVLAHMWLDSEIYAAQGSDAASSSSSSSSSSSPTSSTSSKKGKRSDFEKKLGGFFKHQIESDTSTAYGEGFRQADSAVSFIENLKKVSNFEHSQHSLFAFATVLAKFKRKNKLKALIGDIKYGNVNNVKGFMLIRMNIEAVEAFRGMIDQGMIPNSRTYTILIEHLVRLGKLDAAMEVFTLLPSLRIKRTLKQFLVLVEGFVGGERFDVVRSLLKEMREDGKLPGRAMRCCEDSSDEDEDDDVNEGVDVHMVKLKPWLDPKALANALKQWTPEVVAILEDAKFVWTSRLVCKVLRNFSSAETAWNFFCWVASQSGFTHDIYTVQRMMTLLARHKNVELVDRLIIKVRREGMRLPFSTIRALTKCRRNSDALDVLDEMILNGTCPDIQTFSGITHHFALQGDIKAVQQLFSMVRQSGMEPDAYMNKLLIQAYCKCQRAALAWRVFGDMRNANLMPDAATKDFLVKSLWQEGRRKEAVTVEESYEEIDGVLPLALCGHVWTVSSEDLTRVSNIYSNSVTTSA